MVLDAKTATPLTPHVDSISPDVYKQDFSGFAVDLRAQVSGGTVVTPNGYSWNYNDNNPGDYVNVQGQNTYDLTFTWVTFTGASRQHLITLGYEVGTTWTYKGYYFTVYGSDSPAKPSTQPTTLGTWHQVLTPDALTDQQETVDSQYYSLGVDTGELQIRHALPRYNPLVDPLTLDYRSIAADRMPIFIDHYPLNATQTPVPATVTGQLTVTDLSGSTVFSGATVSYDTSLLNPGDYLEMALQATIPSTKHTGRYNYTITEVANYATPVTTTSSGQVSWINASGNVLGNGWYLDNVERLWPINSGTTQGAIVELPGGLSLWFSGTSYQAPAGDFSTLVQNGGTYTRTLPDGTQYNFVASGVMGDPSYHLLSLVDRNNNALTFAYDTNGNLTSITDFDTQVSNLGYSNGRVSTITDPAGRITALGRDGTGHLTSITDPAPGGTAATPVTCFGYDTTVDHITTLTDPNGHVTNFGFSNGRVTTVTRADQVKELLAPVQLTGLGGGTAALAASSRSVYTDGVGNNWQTGFDALGFGRATIQIDPLSHVQLQERNANGLTWLGADQLSRRTTYQYDSTLGVPTKIALPDDSTEQYTYYHNGSINYELPVGYTNPNNNTTTYTRDTSGNLTLLTQPAPNGGPNHPLTTYTYWPAAPGRPGGLLQSVTDPDRHTTSYGYQSGTPQDLLAVITYPKEAALNYTSPFVTMAYDAAGNLTSRTDERGFVTGWVYDPLNRLTQEQLPNNNSLATTVFSHAYDAASNEISVTAPPTPTSPSGRPTTSAYDALNRRTSIQDPLRHTTGYAYDNDSLLISVTDPLQHALTYSYDGANHLVGVEDALTHTTVYGVDAAGQRTSVTDPVGDVTTYNFDNRGRLSGVIFPQLNQITYGYDADSNITQVTRYDPTAPLPPAPYQCLIYFDNLDRVTSHMDPVGALATDTYDLAGNQLSATGAIAGDCACDCACSCSDGTKPDNSGHSKVSYGYNERNQRTSMTVGDPLTTNYGFDAAGNQTSVTDPLGHSTVTGYDAQNRVTAITAANTGTTSESYDRSGRLISVQDPDRNLTSYFYDDADRLTQTTDALSHSTYYYYDDANRLVGKKDRDGRSITYVYDAANRLTAEQWLDSMSQPTYTLNYGYDNANRLTGANDPSSSYGYGYDSHGRVTGIDNNSAVVSHFGLTFGYDGYNNRKTLNDSQGGHITYTYDGDQHLIGEQLYTNPNQPGPKVTFTFDSDNRVSKVSRIIGSNIITDSIGYDGFDRVTAISYAGASGSPVFTYTYDDGSRIVGYQGLGQTLTYGYDTVNALTSVTGSLSASFGYDLNGNRTMTGYVTTTANRLTSDGTYTYGYDSEGNVTSKSAAGDVTTFTWDHRDRLTEATRTTATVVYDDKFTYDVWDRRITKAVLTNQVTTSYLATVYDGDNPYADFNASQALTYRYLYGDQPDELLARFSGTSSNWYLSDLVGSVRQLTDQTGVVLDQITYDPFGVIVTETNGTNGDRFKFTAREWDAEILQYAYRLRAYIPSSGRFESEDPLGVVGGDPNP